MELVGNYDPESKFPALRLCRHCCGEFKLSLWSDRKLLQAGSAYSSHLQRRPFLRGRIPHLESINDEGIRVGSVSRNHDRLFRIVLQQELALTVENRLLRNRFRVNQC